MTPHGLDALCDASAHPILLDFAGTLKRLCQERLLAISKRARDEFQDRFELEVQGICLLTGATRDRARTQADVVLQPLQRKLEQRRDELTAAPGGSILVGNGGDGELTGGSGRDLLIGGAGTDTLDGQARLDRPDAKSGVALLPGAAVAD